MNLNWIYFAGGSIVTGTLYYLFDKTFKKTYKYRYHKNYRNNIDLVGKDTIVVYFNGKEYTGKHLFTRENKLFLDDQELGEPPQGEFSNIYPIKIIGDVLSCQSMDFVNVTGDVEQLKSNETVCVGGNVQFCNGNKVISQNQNY